MLFADGSEIAEARKVWSTTKDAEAALKKLGYRNCIEKQLLVGLDKYKKNDLVSALNMVRFWMKDLFKCCELLI